MEIDEIRYRHARRLIAMLAGEEGEAGGLSKFAARLGKSQSQVSQFAGKNPVKGIGKMIARQIEEKFGLKHGEIDRPLPEWEGGGKENEGQLSEGQALLLDACAGLDNRAIVKLIQAAGWLRAGMDVSPSPLSQPASATTIPGANPVKTVDEVARHAYLSHAEADLRADSEHHAEQSKKGIAEIRRKPAMNAPEIKTKQKK